jgi:hypothetical protein
VRGPPVRTVILASVFWRTKAAGAAKFVPTLLDPVWVPFPTNLLEKWRERWHSNPQTSAVPVAGITSTFNYIAALFLTSKSSATS